MGSIETVYSWYGLIPALLAVVLAIITRQVIVSLLVAIISGSFIFYIHGAESYFFGLDLVIDKYIVNAISDSGHVSVIVFSMFIAGMVHLLNKIGAFNGLIFWVIRKVKSRRSALFATYFMGFFVFFDDYANTLIVGNTMRNITDKFKISREKLAFIIDATAAPIASIAFVSTWIGFEVDLIADGMNMVDLNTGYSAYGLFMAAIKYSFYPILILFFVFLIIFLNKDFGSMYKYERATHENYKEDESDWNSVISIHPIYVVIPIVSMLLITFLGIYVTGYKEGFSVFEAIQNGDFYKGLLWGSALGLLITALIAGLKGHQVKQIVVGVNDGFKSLIEAITVLILAWALNEVLSDLQLGPYLASLFIDAGIGMAFIPFSVFILSAVIAFSTGSSFSTMGILIPLVIQLFYGLGYTDGSVEVLAAAIASVLSGAVLGDHCSPISDTTILSSMAAKCNHINHVNSQLTYCLVTGGVAGLLLLTQSLFLLHWSITLLLGVGLIYLIIRLFGKELEV